MPAYLEVKQLMTNYEGQIEVRKWRQDGLVFKHYIMKKIYFIRFLLDHFRIILNIFNEKLMARQNTRSKNVRIIGNGTDNGNGKNVMTTFIQTPSFQRALVSLCSGHHKTSSVPTSEQQPR